MLHYTSKSLNFPINWNIKREPIYRILSDVKWMDNFFDKGEIMISCLNNFRNYPDEMRGDVNEGEAIIGGVSDNGNHNAVIYESGMKAFVMSATTELNDKVIKDFNGKCAIKINNPELFGLEISKKLPFVTSAIEGYCNYAESRVHFFKKEQKENSIFQSIDFKNDPRSESIFKQLTMGMELFLKLDKYKHQKEYRLIWFSEEEVNESVLIKCPEATAFCDKIYFDE